MDAVNLIKFTTNSYELNTNSLLNLVASSNKLSPANHRVRISSLFVTKEINPKN
ncbi:hypothetical protein MNV_950008 [Candidatus Methanoperedens nitroreducens]|uniref:Uncharacterized protein n=1 Tax=Candidatus Methanoperedens nitratireducens TaxID=1392998 RepID=A0A284VUN3_9EURY|nr:hypothetical protein MNV_950008 [Candidatus Methanoperedens nitroreducens]